jgi:hypothetical protein
MWLQKGIKGGQANHQPNYQENIFILVLVVVLFIFLYPILVESSYRLAIPVGLLTWADTGRARCCRAPTAALPVICFFFITSDMFF